MLLLIAGSCSDKRCQQGSIRQAGEAHTCCCQYNFLFFHKGVFMKVSSHHFMIITRFKPVSLMCFFVPFFTLLLTTVVAAQTPLPAGSLDASFGSNGKVSLNLQYASKLSSLAVQ